MSAAAASPLLLALQLLLGVGPAVPAKLSVYWPGDGHNKGQLACGGVFSREQVHVAVRDWPQRGCRRRVVVFSAETGRAVLARVMDAGPFGIVRVTGSAGARERGKDWGIWTKSLRAPPGWRFRGDVDLSRGLWEALGRPKFLSRVYLLYLPRERGPLRERGEGGRDLDLSS